MAKPTEGSDKKLTDPEIEKMLKRLHVGVPINEESFFMCLHRENEHLRVSFRGSIANAIHSILAACEDREYIGDVIRHVASLLPKKENEKEE